ncbi:hypothetical protein Ahy_A10g047655 [Arachis hypogaea]|uniref:Uncharacterized protein n=1 Tax=Arachis hypogaea TaxID=3818 RepID=A0A445B326_ARAHY|nr:hypothetical protein Ahy_A10g047655 [Arachis hypogaea]
MGTRGKHGKRGEWDGGNYPPWWKMGRGRGQYLRAETESREASPAPPRPIDIPNSNTIYLGCYLEEASTDSSFWKKKKKMVMRQNINSLVIGSIGAALTLVAYSQTLISPTQCITLGLFVLMFALLIREGLISF